jgi:hypothetical protein
MSYDLKLFSVPQGVEPDTVYEQLIQREESATANIDSTRAAMQQLADAVRVRWPSFVRFQPASALPWIELNEDNLQIQFTVHEQTASITMPYFRELTAPAMECIGCCLSACQELRGYVTYDPQLGRVVTVADLDRMAQQYRAVDESLQHLRGHAAKAKPWWKFWLSH